MGNLLCLLLGLLIPILALGFALLRGLRPMAAASSYRNVAWRLGLEADTRGTSMRGHLEDRRLFVGEVVDVEEGRRATAVLAILDLATPLGLGLVLRQPDRRRFRRARAPSLSTGDRQLDERVEVRAFEPERARALFDADVRAAVLRLLKFSADVEITDLWVRVRLRRPPSSEAMLRSLVDTLRQTVLALEASRVAIGPSPALEERAQVWAEVADRLGLVLDPAYPALAGALDGRPARIVATRTDDGFSADVEVGLRAHPAIGLAIVGQRTDGLAPVGQHITLGDPPFDGAFVVQGWDPGAVRARLDASARADLLALRARGEVEVSDRTIVVRGVALDPEALMGCVRTAEAVAGALGW